MVHNVNVDIDVIPPAEDDRPVWGADAIAKIIGLNKRVTYYLLETGALPCKKVAGRFVSTPRALLRALTPEIV